MKIQNPSPENGGKKGKEPVAHTKNLQVSVEIETFETSKTPDGKQEWGAKWAIPMKTFPSDHDEGQGVKAVLHVWKLLKTSFPSEKDAIDGAFNDVKRRCSP